MSRLMLFAILALVTGCSVYRSDGRKFLEGDLGTIGVSVQAYVQSCDRDGAIADWQMLPPEPQVNLFSRGEGGDLRVVPAADPNFHCDYRFPNAESRANATPAAIDYTLHALQEPLPRTSPDRAPAP